ncbi:MAG: hypothetical protein JXR03_10130 [Cyclobacteriaceae bacterium]
MKKTLLRIIFTCCVLITGYLSVGQKGNLKYNRLGVDQGLSQGNVTALMEDRYGFVWIGTEDGLNVYNGYSFDIFRNEIDDSTSISDNWISSLLEDGDGNIWIGTFNGLNKYDREQNEFVHFMEDEKANSINHDAIFCLFKDSKENVWIGTKEGLSMYRKNTNDFLNIVEDLTGPNLFRGSDVSAIVEDKLGRLWIGTNKGLNVRQSTRESFVHYGSDKREDSGRKISSNDVKSLFIDSKNRLWIGYFQNGLDMMDLNTGIVLHYVHESQNPKSLTDDYVKSIAENEKGEVWIATDGGLCLFNEEGTFTSFGNEANDDLSLSSNIMSIIMIDSNENMWVGTRLGGVCVSDYVKYSFGLYRNNPADDGSLLSNYTAGYAENKDGTLAVATDGGGISFYDRQSDSFTHLYHDPDNPKGSITNNKVLALEYDESGGIWLGMWNGGLNYYNPKTSRVKHYKYDKDDPNSLPTDNIFDLFTDSKGRLWIGTWGAGLCLYDRETDSFKTMLDQVPILRTCSINKIIEDDEGNLWIANDQAGLVVFNYDTGFVHQYEAGGKEGDLTNKCTFALLIDSKDRLWVGTNTGGLNLLDRKTDKFSIFTKEDGLPSNSIQGILEDDDGYIWVSSNNGLSRIQTDSMIIKNYDKGEGLQGNQFMPRNSIKLSTGELIFGGNDGFNKFDPKDLRDNATKPPVYITKFKLFNKDVQTDVNGVLKKNIILADKIELNYDQNFFSFEYTGINYKQSHKNEYQYILEGLQDEWVLAGDERKVSYTNVNPGTYTFKVKASNNDGVWNEQPAIIKVFIRPPFWATWWFRSLVIIALATSGIWIYRHRQAKILADRLLLERKVDEATEQVITQNSKLKEQGDLLKAAIDETNFVVKAAVESGNFNARIETVNKDGEWKYLAESINSLFESVSEPFNDINHVIGNLANGDLTSQYTGRARGDIKRLTENLNTAIDNLRSLLGDIASQVTVIGNSSGEMLESTEEMNLNTGEISSAISEISHGASEQQSQIDQSSNLLEDILTSANDMIREAEKINQTADIGSGISRKGMSLIEKLNQSMQKILSYSIQTNDSISDLTKGSERISSVVEIIKEIAAQTNLLALNATIEAAQAGESGRGFAVVADEIRKLAEGSKNSVSEIQDLIGAVQKDTNSTAKLIGDMGEQIKAGDDASRESLLAFQKIADQYQETLVKSEQIVIRVNQQTADVKNVVDISRGIVVISEQTAAGTEEVASSANELASGMSTYTDKTRKVSQITDDLVSKVSKFKH